MTTKSTGPRSPLVTEGTGNGAGPVLLDRAAMLLEHADDANDTVCFWEGDNVTNRWKYIERVDVPDVRALGVEEFISQRYGGGKYKAGLRHRSSGAYGSSVVVEIVGPPKSLTARDAARGVLPPTPAAVTASRGSPMPDWVEKLLLLVGVPVAMQIVKKLLEPKTADPMLLELMKQLGKQNAPAGSSSSPLDHVKLLHSMLELQDALAERAGSGGSSTPASDAAAQLGAGGIAGVIERQLPGVINLLNKKIDMDERRSTRATQPPRATPAPALPTVPTVERPTPGTAAADPLVTLLQHVPAIARSFILSGAESDENPAVYADLILGKLDDESYAAVATYLERPDFVDVFCATMPAFGQYRPWVEELAAAMCDSIASAAAELSAGDVESAGAPAHSGDSPSSESAPA